MYFTHTFLYGHVIMVAKRKTGSLDDKKIFLKINLNDFI